MDGDTKEIVVFMVRYAALCWTMIQRNDEHYFKRTKVHTHNIFIFNLHQKSTSINSFQSCNLRESKLLD